MKELYTIVSFKNGSKRHNKHLIRAVYENDMNLPVLVTVYYPSTDRYYEGGEKFADKILR